MNDPEPKTSRSYVVAATIRIVLFLVSLVASIILTSKTLALLSGIGTIYSILWLIGKFTGFADTDRFPSRTYFVTIGDVLFQGIYFWLLGTLNSKSPAIMAYGCGVASLNTRIRQGRSFMLGMIAVFVVISLLTYFDVLPKYNVLGGESNISNLQLAVGLVVIPAVLYGVHHTVQRITNQNSRLLAEIARQRDENETLLLNVLPEAVAIELKTTGESKPMRVDQATIMFTDFAGFTRASADVDPAVVVSSLNSYFSYFDERIEAHGLEKLKTIGDGYMCAGGIPRPNGTHAIDVCLAAIELMDYVRVRRGDDPLKLGIRVGIHTGPAMAGIVGKRRFSYDIWGETVNLASRHEGSCEPMSINVSKQTYLLTKDFFQYRSRGPIEVKSYGKLDQFELTGIQEQYIDRESNRPNQEFQRAYSAISLEG